jgi:peptide/nickel transport system substrate-binding protein
MGGASTRGGTLRIAVPNLPPGFDPTLHAAGNGRLFGEQLYSTLTMLDDASAPQPSLAESLAVSPDRRTYTVHLRPGARFHDGREVSAADVAFTFTRQADPATKYHHGHWSEAIMSAEALDPRTARITLSRPVDAFPTWLAFHGSAIVPADRAARGELASAPIGSGPYVLASAGARTSRPMSRPGWTPWNSR